MLGLVLRRPACLAEDAAGRYISPFHDIPLRDGGAEVSGDGPLGPLGTGSVGVGLQGGAGRGAGVVPPPSPAPCACVGVHPGCGFHAWSHAGVCCGHGVCITRGV